MCERKIHERNCRILQYTHYSQTQHVIFSPTQTVYDIFQTLTNKEDHRDVSLVLVSIYNGNKEKHSVASGYLVQILVDASIQYVYS